MPFNGSGTFQRLMNWVADATSGIKIRADRHDQEDDNFAAGLTNCLTKDGQTTPTADIKLGGKKLINVADPISPQDAVTKNYVDTALSTRVEFIKRTLITTSSTTFQFDPATTWAEVEVQGAGGAGGGTTGSTNGTATTLTAAAGSGGQAGAYCKKTFAITPTIRAATKTITVGAGGTGALGNGNAGGNSSYDDTVNTLTANGGFGGIAGAQSNQAVPRNGNTYNSASGGDTNITGMSGGPSNSFGGFYVSGSGTAQAGNGGASTLGGGGGPGSVQSQTAGPIIAPGLTGNLGAGGGGGLTVGAAATNTSGGAGGAGIVAIREYR